MKLCTSWRALLVAPLALPALVSAPVASAAPAPAATKALTHYNLPAGRIVYQVSGVGAQGGNGTIDMKWSNNGKMFRQDIQMAVGRAGSRVPPVNTWMIFDGKAMYVAMPTGAGMDKMVLKMAPNPAQLKQMSGGIGMTGMGGSSGKLVGKGTVLGKPCEIRLVDSKTARGTGQAKMWLWQGLPLRTELTSKASTGATTKMTMVATKLDTALKPAPSLFKVPAGYKVQDMSAMMSQMMGKR